ncbi:Glycosyl transferase family 2 [Formivibrio citricus]|uniref:Glycosyl transferase family 2 n=1 Tax=Formivibrio citricus TaxID=83765 RepID=A0A1I5CAR1_9NEIS|nr:glycosyltransferase [Formivibrio citricus]SFN84100.1 Glycosyl transferase family 2 [Formivibrio citricus]
MKLVCLIPHYNNPHGLAKSLASIGSDEQCDVLVVDDGSIKQPLDEAAARAAFAAQGELHFLRLPQNRGIEHALNAGLAWIAERGYELIARLDCGDENLPDRFARQTAFLEQHPEIALLGGAASFVDLQGAEQFVLRHPTGHAEICRALKNNSAFIHPTVVMRRSAVEAAGGYPLDARAAEDYALFWTLAECFQVANLPDVLIRYELDPGGISLGKRWQQLCSRLAVQQRHNDGSLAAWIGMLRTRAMLLLPYGMVFKLKSWLRG